jgi:EAL domain-containing protein (putative c-di-GMP-specific phosphodiesterase class I)
MNADVTRGLNVAVQPLITLATGEILGYEALALAGGWMADLELALARRAFQAANEVLTGGQRLFLNVHPSALETPGFAQRLRAAARKERFRLSRTVIEITEQGPIAKPESAMANLEILRDAGALFALDDFGSGYAHMRWLHEIRPRFLKIAQSIATDFEAAAWRRSVVQNLQHFAKDVGCAVIVEGVETPTTADAARAMGIEYGQGYYFGRPVMSAYSSACGTSPSAGNSRTSMASSTSPS